MEIFYTKCVVYIVQLNNLWLQSEQVWQDLTKQQIKGGSVVQPWLICPDYAFALWTPLHLFLIKPVLPFFFL